MADDRVTSAEIAKLETRLSGLIGVQLDVLRLPRAILHAFEPSQIGTIAGTLMDACIPELPTLLRGRGHADVGGIEKHEGILGEREGYPDYRHESGLRLELKLLYKDPVDVEMKSPPTPREASARLTQKVTVKNVQPETDVLMVVVYQLTKSRHPRFWLPRRFLPRTHINEGDIFSPTIVDIGLFPMIDCIRARDDRLERSGGKWFGNYETPCVPSKIGRGKLEKGEPLDDSSYGRKESEGKDLNEDTNFGKLKRVPYMPLQLFLKKHGATYASNGEWPTPWTIP